MIKVKFMWTNIILSDKQTRYCTYLLYKVSCIISILHTPYIIITIGQIYNNNFVLIFILFNGVVPISRQLKLPIQF